MRSTSGEHYVALDHVRAVAALLVFVWHFIHAGNGYPIGFEYTPSVFFMALLDEGHTGVALFMVLSGYLFARLLNQKFIHYGLFLWNRVVRLLPLLLLVIVLAAVQQWALGGDMATYWNSVRDGWLRPTLPNGGWSVTVEFHFYLVLPLLLWLLRRSRWLPLGVVAVAVALRYALWVRHGEVQTLAYATLIGRIDQFVLGLMAFHFRTLWAGKHARALLVVLGFSLFYWYFDKQGGFYQSPRFPSPHALWVVMPTIEGLAYGIAIAWYDNSFVQTQMPTWRGVISRAVAAAGAYSYSIYLLHFFVVFRLARFIDEHLLSLDNFYVACACAVLAFIAMVPLGYASFRWVESPFLRHRRPYVRSVGDA